MSTKKTLLLIGGGHAHALFLVQWRKQPAENTQLIVIDPQPRVPYTGMLPGFIAGHYQIDDLYIDLQQLINNANGTLVIDAAEHIDPEQQTVRTASGQVYEYDVLSVDIGIHTQLSLPGFAQHAVAAKPLHDFAMRWEEFIARQNRTKHSTNMVVIGGGVAGVELALAGQHRLQQAGVVASFVIIDQGQMLQNASKSTQRYLRKVLDKSNIDLVEGATVTRVTGSEVETDAGSFPSDFTLVATGPQPYRWLAQTKLANTRGYLDITSTLQTNAYPTIFAVGDCAHFMPSPVPKAGVYAVRQAPILHHNICAYLAGSSLRSFQPQSDYLKLISLGEKRAAADKWGWCWQGIWLWWLKHFIDRRFMKKCNRDVSV